MSGTPRSVWTLHVDESTDFFTDYTHAHTGGDGHTKTLTGHTSTIKLTYPGDQP